MASFLKKMVFESNTFILQNIIILQNFLNSDTQWHTEMDIKYSGF